MMLNRKENLTPAEDFDFLGKVCQITSIAHEWRTYSVSNAGHISHNTELEETFCEDKWQATFMVPASTGMSEKSVTARWEAEIRPGVDDCGEGADDEVGGSFEIGEEVDCWKPADNGNKDDVSELYRCGNDDCIKIFDPAEEIKTHSNAGYYIMLVFGIIEVVIAAALFINIGISWFK